MPSYRVSITTVDPTGQPGTFRGNVRASRPEDAVDIACAHLGVQRDLDRSFQPSGSWYSQARGVRVLSLCGRRFGTVSRTTEPPTPLATLARS